MLLEAAMTSPLGYCYQACATATPESASTAALHSPPHGFVLTLPACLPAFVCVCVCSCMCCRRSRAASCFVFNMMVPAANDVMNLVMTFGCSKPWPVDCTTTSSTSSTITGGDSNNKASNKGSGAAKATTGSGGGGGSSGAEPSSSGSGSSGDTGAGFQNTLRRCVHDSRGA